MAIGQMTFFSKALQRDVSFHFILPNDAQSYVTEHNAEYDRPMKTLYLLHGYNSAADNWILNSSIMDIALRYNLCVIFPNGENSFYLNAEATGRQYATYTGEELVAYTRETFGLSEKREDTLIGGFSMGGGNAASTVVNFPIDTPFSGVSLEDREFFAALLQNEAYLSQYHEYLRILCEDYVFGGAFDAFYESTRERIDELTRQAEAARGKRQGRQAWQRSSAQGWQGRSR